MVGRIGCTALTADVGCGRAAGVQRRALGRGGRALLLSIAIAGGVALWLSLAGGAVAQGSPAAQAQAAPPAQAPVTVNVDLSEWSVAPNLTSVAAGVPVHFVVRNAGTISHQLQLTAAGMPNVESGVLAPGESYAFDVTFGAAASVQLLCPIGNVERDEPVPAQSHRQRGMQTSFQVTAPPAGVTVPATPALPPAPTIGALTAPGANVDRVGLPPNYQQTFRTFYVFDRPDNRQVRHVYANAPAASVRPGQPYPYGSILVMETWRAKLTPDNQLDLGADGRFQKDALTGIFVMRKEPGFGAKYGPDRNGEWEYVSYRPDDGQLATAPERSQACAQCHLVASSAQKDWVVRENLFFEQALSLLRLPATGGHDFLGPRPSILPLGMAAVGPILLLAGLAFRSAYAGRRAAASGDDLRGERHV
jgi:hemoglobin